MAGSLPRRWASTLAIAVLATAAVSIVAASATADARHRSHGAPAKTSFWIYRHGHFAWPGDYSYSVKVDYHDFSGHAAHGYADIKVSLTGPWGGWQPYSPHWHFNSRPYSRLTFRLKPTVARQSWSCQFVKVGDVPVGISVDVAKYGPAPVAGRWATYTIPLAALGVKGASIYKFAIQDQTGRSSNTWYVDDVGFVR